MLKDDQFLHVQQDCKLHADTFKEIDSLHFSTSPQNVQVAQVYK